MANSSNNNKIVELSSARYVRIAEHEGREVRLYARPINPEDFQDCQVYSLTASRGKVKGEAEYFVTTEDYSAHKPARATGVTKLSDDALMAEFIARGLKV